jgi:hypothetical protein
MPRIPNNDITSNLHIRIPTTDYQRLQNASDKRMVSVNAICIRAIEWYLNRLEKEVPLP